MPFLMEVEDFAYEFANAVERKKRFVIIPWQMAIVAKIMRLIPDWLWDWLMKKAPHKARIDV